ncbi:MAG TPA: class I SAM-dependent methyltransferase [Caulobacteraceae bacterium]
MASRTSASCRICGHAGDNTRYRVREMLHGTREAFDYFECAACGCVQIEDIPDDLGRFYPADYFSFKALQGLDRNLVRRLIDPRRVKNSFGQADLIGRAVEAVSRPLDYVSWLKDAGLGPDASILDIGCGQGKTLLCMALGGLRPCHGVDPFIARTIRYRSGATVHKAELATFARDSAERYDFIMFHHSLEHVVDPLAALSDARALLAPGGRMLIVVPVAASAAWEMYREDWVNLDPPRHIHLLTARSMEILADAAGLEVAKARSVGGVSQFTGSERYRRDIPATDRRPDRSLFTAAQLARFRDETGRWNLEGQGDQTMFVLRAAEASPGTQPP